MPFKNSVAQSIAVALIDTGLAQDIAQQVQAHGTTAFQRAYNCTPTSDIHYHVTPDLISQYASLEVRVMSGDMDGRLEKIWIAGEVYQYRCNASVTTIRIPLPLDRFENGFDVTFSEFESSRNETVMLSTRTVADSEYRISDLAAVLTSGDFLVGGNAALTVKETPFHMLLGRGTVSLTGVKYISIPCQAGKRLSVGVQMYGATGTTTVMARESVSGTPLSPTLTLTNTAGGVIDSSPLPAVPIDLRVQFPTSYSALALLCTYA